MVLPLYSCPFKGCSFCTDDREKFLRHFSRNPVDAPHLTIIEEHCGAHFSKGFEPLDFVYRAIRVRENEKFPTLGMAVTRRTLRMLTQSFNDASTKAIMCATCNAIRPTISGHVHEKWNIETQAYEAQQNKHVKYVNRE